MTPPPPVCLVLPVDKPAGITSFDVVRAVRRTSRVKRVGHAGTLDPMATGLLVVLLGEATKLQPVLMEGEKEYRAVLRLGTTTETGDADGKVVETRDASAVTRAAVEAVLPRFIGEISQKPPAYSAVKIDGERAYDLARRGEEVPTRPRKVRVGVLEILSFEPPDAALRIVCSKGTYVRALATDIGDALGVGGHIAEIRRLRSGDLTVDRATPLDAITRENWREKSLRPGDALASLPRFVLSAAGAAAMRGGRDLPRGGILKWPAAPVGARAVVVDEAGDLIAFGTVGRGGDLVEKRIFQG